MRTLLHTPGSPFARAIRILLHELDLDYTAEEADSGVEQRLEATPTLQVPTLRDGEVRLWESGLIAEYLLATYEHRPAASPPLAQSAWREAALWHDKLVFATIQTFGTAATTIFQLTWTGVEVGRNDHLDHCAVRMQHILGWLEGELPFAGNGFFEDALSVHDIFLASHIAFVRARPLGVDLDLERPPKVQSLMNRMAARASFTDVPILWDPDVVSYERDGTPVYRR